MVKSDIDAHNVYHQAHCYEPWIVDRHGRTIHNANPNHRVFEPFVSKRLHKNGFNPIWPSGHEFAVSLTHDVDLVRYAFDSRIDMILKRIAAAMRNDTNNPSGQGIGKTLADFEGIMNAEMSFGAKSTFFFIGANPDSGTHRYEAGQLGKSLKSIINRGWEVGLHLLDNHLEPIENARGDKKRLEDASGAPISGCRIHGLVLRIPQSWRVMEQLGIRYDSTLAFPDCPGFRNGMCYPFKPYDLINGREIDLWEIPLVVTDNQLFDYLRLDKGNAWKLLRHLIDQAKDSRGVFTVLWHNTHLIEEEGARLYSEMLNYCTSENAWIATSRDIVDWWETENY